MKNKIEKPMPLLEKIADLILAAWQKFESEQEMDAEKLLA
jgi:hypothetical protein